MVRRIVEPDIKPGFSITRFHLAVENPMFPDNNTEIHVAHHPDGNLDEPAQWYEIVSNLRQEAVEAIRTKLMIDKQDWKILEHLLGSFRWALYWHPPMGRKSVIKMDEQAMRADEWTTTYF